MCFTHTPTAVFMRSRRIDHRGSVTRTRRTRRVCTRGGETLGTLPRCVVTRRTTEARRERPARSLAVA